MCFRELFSAGAPETSITAGRLGMHRVENSGACKDTDLFARTPASHQTPKAQTGRSQFSLNPAEVNSAITVKTSAARNVAFRAKTKPAGSSVVKLAALMPV